MGYEPTTFCTECGDPFDVYRAPEERVCDNCMPPAPIKGEGERKIVERVRVRRACGYCSEPAYLAWALNQRRAQGHFDSWARGLMQKLLTGEWRVTC